MDRRKLLDALTKAMGLLVTGVLAVPAALLALSPALRRRTEDAWRPLGRLQQFAQGEVTEARFEVPRADWSRHSLRHKTVYVWRPAEEELVVFSRNCTDLSCPVNFDRGSQCYLCPCHGGIFDRDGTPLAGPPSRPLYRYATRVRDGVLEIDARSVPPMA
jgi:menaquinol-cytochrome c reductase iron-sulfur subunit